MLSSASVDYSSFAAAHTEHHCSTSRRTGAQESEHVAECLEALQPGQWLFRVGDPKHVVYRIEAGAVLVARHSEDGVLTETRLAFAGETIGLGFLTTHRSSAAAIVATTVVPYTPQQIEDLCAVDAVLRAQRDAAIRDEFDQLRQDTAGASSQEPLSHKVANFLVVASHLASLEGRKPDLTADALDLAQLTTIFRCDDGVMLTVLQALECHGVIAYNADSTIEITDLERLERFAEDTTGDAQRVYRYS